MLLHDKNATIEPQLSRVARWGAIGPPLFLLVTSGIFIIEFSHTHGHRGDLAMTLEIVVGFPIAMLAVPILGALAIRQIKRSNGRVYGLKLAAMEVILLPAILLFAMIAFAVFWLVSGLLTILLPRQVPLSRTEPPSPTMVASVLLLAALPAALIISAWAGRSAWRAIVGRKAATLPRDATGCTS